LLGTTVLYRLGVIPNAFATFAEGLRDLLMSFAGFSEATPG